MQTENYLFRVLGINVNWSRCFVSYLVNFRSPEAKAQR